MVILAEGGSFGGEESGNKLNVWLLSGLEDNPIGLCFPDARWLPTCVAGPKR